jgi:hypothetical protein
MPRIALVSHNEAVLEQTFAYSNAKRCARERFVRRQDISNLSATEHAFYEYHLPKKVVHATCVLSHPARLS